MATQSILKSVRKVCNLAEEDSTFDTDLILHTNSALATLNQLGVGPEFGYEIEDDAATWDAIIGTNHNLSSVRTYVCLLVRMAFDPPQTAHHVTAMQKQIDELAWRINRIREDTDWTDPNTEVPEAEDYIFDGGAP